MGREQKQKRRGGARDETTVNINFTQDQLMAFYIWLEHKLGVSYVTTATKQSDNRRRKLPFLF